MSVPTPITANMDQGQNKPLGHRWRSSKPFVLACIIVGLFSETFLYGFVVPILSYMLEVRLHTNPGRTQQLTSAVLAIHGFVSAISGPVIGHFADKISNRKAPLLVSLLGCIVGTVMVAAATSLWILLAGRVLQGIAGSAVWIVGISTAAERVGEENLGKVMGIANSFIMAGSISGPMVSGLLFEAFGYWPTWAAPLAVLVLDIIARLIMAEPPKSCSRNPDHLSSPSSCPTSFDAAEQERSPLLSETQDSYQSMPNPPGDSEHEDLSTSLSFYRAMLRNSRILAALLTSMAVAVVIVGMDATLPLHVRDVFGWGPGQTGMMFLYLQVPSIVVGPFAGWTRDRVGLRYPVSLSLATFAGLMWLQGVPGDRRFPWASADTRGPTIYITSMLAIGTVTPFLTGIGILEMTAVVKAYMARDPTIFGPNGGFSRAFAMSDVATTLAMMMGPVIAGALHETVGYYYMNVIFGSMFLLLSAAFFFFGGAEEANQRT